MDTKNPQLDASAPHLCKICQQPIGPGPDMEHEINAGQHRLCFRSTTKQDVVAEKSHALWLKGYALLRNALGQKAEDTVVPLAYATKQEPRSYLVFLRRANALLPEQGLPEEQVQALQADLEAISDEIKAMLSGGCN